MSYRFFAPGRACSLRKYCETTRCTSHGREGNACSTRRKQIIQYTFVEKKQVPYSQVSAISTAHVDIISHTEAICSFLSLLPV